MANRMSLSSWLKERKLASIERKLKVLHVEQRQNRDRLRDLEQRRKKESMTTASYEADKAKLDARKHEMTEKINALHAEQEAAKRDLEAMRAPA